MQKLSIQLEDWQQAALHEMAHSRGIEVETLARAILNERLIERIHTSFDDLVSPDSLLLASEVPAADTIEQRLRRLFEA
jgi:hypothetical protein